MISDSIYSSVLHNVVLPASLALTRSNCYSLYKDMLALEYTDRRAVERLQWQRFEKLLAHAYEHVPYYRAAFDELRVKPEAVRDVADLLLLPELSKRQIQRNFPDRITAQNRPSSDWQYVSTRGTSNRLVTIQDFPKRDSVRATELRAAHLSGDYRVGRVWVEIPPDACSVVCGDEREPDGSVFSYSWELLRGRKLLEPKNLSNLRGLIERKWIYRRETYPSLSNDGTSVDDERISQYVDRLRRDRPFLLKGLPTYLHKIAKFVRDHGVARLPVHTVKPMGGSVSPLMREVIRAAFAGEFREDYGSSEFGGIACDCERNNGLHIFSDAFIIEIVKDNRHCAPGEVGRVLVTDLSNFAMPMIRYEIGDLASIDPAPCSCGRTGALLRVEGRFEDSLEGPSGEILTNDVLMDLFYSIPAVDQFQIIQKAKSQYHLSIVAERGHSPDLAAIIDRLKGVLGPAAAIEGRMVTTIAAEHSGKFRFVKRLMNS